jgi:hypothetical protein
MSIRLVIEYDDASKQHVEKLRLALRDVLLEAAQSGGANTGG